MSGDMYLFLWKNKIIFLATDLRYQISLFYWNWESIKMCFCMLLHMLVIFDFISPADIVQND